MWILTDHLNHHQIHISGYVSHFLLLCNFTDITLFYQADKKRQTE